MNINDLPAMGKGGSSRPKLLSAVPCGGTVVAAAAVVVVVVLIIIVVNSCCEQLVSSLLLFVPVITKLNSAP